ncbi:MAG: EscE/YscE/SsaE family type III secretion system needle protein co-chaperone [Candidatus Competibacteraceae bacterium]|jgi:type III secretion system YseE family protein|nr:EscE/YscE/SsaE family type III secretion system needle protein co-chaperone [Candidatus Competibacteraceae bacterium]
MAEKNEPWLPVEQTLKEDANGEERDALMNRLQDQARTIKRKMDAGVTPKEFAELDTLHKAFETASQVVAIIWRRYHPT